MAHRNRYFFVAWFLFLLYNVNLSRNSLPSVQSGLVAYYPFNGNANDMVNANHGIVHSAQLTTDRFGTGNSAYTFGNWKYIDVSSINEILSNIKQFTISLWVYPTDFGSMYPTIFSAVAGYTGNNYENGDFFYLQGFGDWVGSGHEIYRKIEFRVISDHGCNTFTSTLSKYQWTHIVSVYDGFQSNTSATAIYQNGKIIQNSAPSRIGGNCVGGKTKNYSYVGIGIAAYRMHGSYENSKGWGGKIDDIAIYSRVLNANEIQRLYDGSTTSTPTNNPTTKNPTLSSLNPSSYPTLLPSTNPSNNPSVLPTKSPTIDPTISPTRYPTKYPTISPTKYPTISPTYNPSITPSKSPSKLPTKNPTITPTKLIQQYHL
eukprot:317601_1